MTTQVEEFFDDNAALDVLFKAYEYARTPEGHVELSKVLACLGVALVVAVEDAVDAKAYKPNEQKLDWKIHGRTFTLSFVLESLEATFNELVQQSAPDLLKKKRRKLEDLWFEHERKRKDKQ